MAALDDSSGEDEEGGAASIDEEASTASEEEGAGAGAEEEDAGDGAGVGVGEREGEGAGEAEGVSEAMTGIVVASGVVSGINTLEGSTIDTSVLAAAATDWEGITDDCARQGRRSTVARVTSASNTLRVSR